MGQIVQIENAKEFGENMPKGLVMVYIGAPWCGPCQRFGPVMEAGVKELEGTVYRLDLGDRDKPVDISETVFKQVKGIPALMVFEDGELKYHNSPTMKFIAQVLGSGELPFDHVQNLKTELNKRKATHRMKMFNENSAERFVDNAFVKVDLDEDIMDPFLKYSIIPNPYFVDFEEDEDEFWIYQIGNESFEYKDTDFIFYSLGSGRFLGANVEEHMEEI